MIQIFTPSYDFKKTYYRNFYDNRKEGMIKGSKYGRFARNIHGKHALDYTAINGTIWDKNTEAWVPDETSSLLGSVELRDTYQEYYLNKDVDTKYSMNSCLDVMYPSLQNAITWMESKGFNNPDSRELVIYKPGYQATTRIAYKDNEDELTEDEKIIEWLTNEVYKIDFIKISERITDKTYYSYNYTMEEISAPTFLNNGPISGSTGKSCIFIPDEEVVVPLTNVNKDSDLWNLSGETITLGRNGEAKYTCDILDEINYDLIRSVRTSIPMRYSLTSSPTLPDPGRVRDVNDDFRKVMSILIFEQRGEYDTSAIHNGYYNPIFSGVYVMPLIMLYYNIIDLRDRALAFQ